MTKPPISNGPIPIQQAELNGPSGWDMRRARGYETPKERAKATARPQPGRKTPDEITPLTKPKGIMGRPRGRVKIDAPALSLDDPPGADTAALMQIDPKDSSSEAVRAVARCYTQQAMLTLVDVAQNSINAAARVSAAIHLLDRAWGRSKPEREEIGRETKISVNFNSAERPSVALDSKLIEHDAD